MIKTTCTVCAQTDCKVGGLHGMIRDRAAAAKQQPEWVRRANANTLPPKVFR